ncbi:MULTISPECIES: phage terminase large subunit family protein [Pseudomonas aeruginosa group]|uniref:Phage terminase large subunit family protein n=10 Tax=Pseudomonas aeruginosa group TaxID=136841 RepID=A0A2R3IUA4_9PSED|nr:MULTISPECIES: terminase gpA endonuclease subunit [Pseudomonas aeruginosa group]AVK05506.1 phage terminase large subunit family protein [Pseudomonas paraeruginosa]EIU3463831.1 phage terminase large subunit family protein [Pseudomonas aeruginosa]EKQ6324247.1 phage terminase large subunit family protein [Pseudomonas aeruginosa]EKQ7204362.1 phage terminase large subunit family protein [Pseudomonas aeruginosa]EKT0639221.1 phage terminase large subunit family protein [Pseudomonas aeruginosa]
MSTLQPWISDLRTAVKLGLQGMFKEPPMTAVEWADKHFYMSAESSYNEGRWKTAPFQIAILNAMGNDLIRVVNFVKSARIGYTKLLLANIGYKIQHKRRNVMMWSPTDPDAEDISKSHVNGLIRDVPVMLELAPWFGRKHSDNTLDNKVFANRRNLWIRGGKASRNYREKSPDEVIYDELSKFDADVEGEGSPTFLGDKRLDGAVYPKSIRGSTPGVAGSCQITKAAEESPHRLRLHIACPHCQREQHLKFGGKDCEFGLKWEKNELGEAERAWYVCEHCAACFEHRDMVVAQAKGRWICDETGIWTRDSIDWFGPDNEPIRTPRSVSFYCWAIYSTWTTWVSLVDEWLKVKGDREKLITFINTTRGEVWEEEQGDRVEWQALYARRENYPKVPPQALVLMGGIDTQDDRYEGRVWAFGLGEEAWLVHRFILTGDPASEELRRKVGLEIHRQFTRADGVPMRVERWCWDAGGHYADEVEAESVKHGVHWVVPTFGASTYGKPIANFPKRRKRKVYKTELGTDNAKELIYSRLRIDVPIPWQPTPGCVHFPIDSDICDEDELKQITAEKKKPVMAKGVRVLRWDSGGRRNEALDCFVYALAALRISQQRFGLDLDQLERARVDPVPEQVAQQQPSNENHASTSQGWLNTGSGPWL